MLAALLDIALDLATGLSTEARYQRLTSAVGRVVPCDAVALLRFDGRVLVPVGVEGLSPETLGHRFDPADHPRFAAILDSRDPVRFAVDDPRPDPYDGLVAGAHGDHLQVHACMGSSLYVDNELVGALTVDALSPGAFDSIDDQSFATCAALAAAAMRTATMIETLERTAEHRGRVTRQLVTEALQRGGAQLLGTSPAMRELGEELDVIADAELTALITGETGVGKELVARTLHAQSPRADQPLVHVNCAALPESIAESELFGHVRGAFTSAVQNRLGKFELADKGTLFLDEIGELPLSIQPLLLRALQFGEVQRVGSDREQRVDVRVIAATNRDLTAEVKAGRFRADLYHRLSVYPIHVPPLRERGADVLVLAGYFADRDRVGLGLGPVTLAASARGALERYDWPGNVRELEHMIVRALLRTRAGGSREKICIEEHHLDLAPRPRSRDSSAGVGSPALALAEATAMFQRQTISDALSLANGNWAEVARQLHVDRGNLHRLAKRLGLK